MSKPSGFLRLGRRRHRRADDLRRHGRDDVAGGLPASRFRRHRLVARRRVGDGDANFLFMGLAGFAWGALSDRYGTRIVVLVGAVLLGLGSSLRARRPSSGSSSSPTACWSALPPAASMRR